MQKVAERGTVRTDEAPEKVRRIFGTINLLARADAGGFSEISVAVVKLLICLIRQQWRK
jgi:hypothetical protein